MVDLSSLMPFAREMRAACHFRRLQIWQDKLGDVVVAGGDVERTLRIRQRDEVATTLGEDRVPVRWSVGCIFTPVPLTSWVRPLAGLRHQPWRLFDFSATPRR